MDVLNEIQSAAILETDVGMHLAYLHTRQSSLYRSVSRSL